MSEGRSRCLKWNRYHGNALSLLCWASVDVWWFVYAMKRDTSKSQQTPPSMTRTAQWCHNPGPLGRVSMTGRSLSLLHSHLFHAKEINFCENHQATWASASIQVWPCARTQMKHWTMLLIPKALFMALSWKWQSAFSIMNMEGKEEW